MKHPDQATLALHAGGDLGWFARYRVERHLSQCDRCRDEVDAFAATRDIIPDLAEIPEVPWNRLAAEMRANIRLGLEAGECVRAGDVPLRQTPLFNWARAAVALASIVALLVTGIALERPAPTPLTAVADDITIVQATDNGIQIRRGAQAFRLNNPYRLDPQQPVTYSIGAQGSMGARYVDPETFYVTINRVHDAD
jgi:anti-sigma factor RsiW